MHMKKKLLVTAIASAGLSSGAFAQLDSTTLNDDMDVPRIAAGGSVNAEHQVLLTDADDVQIVVDHRVILKLPEGAEFNAAPTATVSLATPANEAFEGLLLNDASNVGTTGVTIPAAVTLEDLDSNGTMESATVTVSRANKDGDAITWSNIDFSYDGSAAVGTDLVATNLILDTLDNTDFLDTDNVLAKVAAAAATPLQQMSADADILIQFEDFVDRDISGSTMLLTVPAGGFAAATDIDLVFGGGVENATSGTSATLVTLTDSAPDLTDTGPDGASGYILTIPISTLSEPSQYLVTFDAIDTVEDDGALGPVTLGFDAGSAVLPGGAPGTLAIFSQTGSAVSLVDPATSADTIVVREAERERTIPDVSLLENFDGDIKSGTLTLEAGSGMSFTNTGANPIDVDFGAAGDLSAGGATVYGTDEIVIDIVYDGGPDGTRDEVIIGDIDVLAVDGAPGTLSIVFGDPGADAENTPAAQSLGVASSQVRGGTTIGQVDDPILVGPGTVGNTGQFRLLEDEYGSIASTPVSQSAIPFIRLNPSANAEFNDAGSDAEAIDTPATGFGMDVTGIIGANSTMELNGVDISGGAAAADAPIPGDPQDAVVFEVTLESAERTLIEFNVNFDVDAGATIGDPVSVNIDGASGVTGMVDIAVVSSTTTTTIDGAIPQVTANDPDAQPIGDITTTELFDSATSDGAYRIILSQGATFDTATDNDAAIGTTIDDTFFANDTLIVDWDATGGPDDGTIEATVFYGAVADGFVTAQIVDGDETGANGAGVSAETINIAFVGDVGMPTIPTTAEAFVGVPLDLTITGGAEPYTAMSGTPAVGTVMVDGAVITVTPLDVGSTVVTVTDGLGNTDTTSVTVAASSPPEDLTTIDSDGNATTASISGGVSSNNGGTFSKDATVNEGDTIDVDFVITPEADHVGMEAGIVVAVVDKTTGIITVLDGNDGLFYLLDEANPRLFQTITLEATNTIGVASDVAITAAEVGLDVDIHVGYIVDGVIYYNNEAVMLTVE